MSSSKSVITLYNVVESLVLCVTIICFGKLCFQCVMQSFGFTVLVVLVAFLLAYKDYGGRFNESFLTCAFLLFFSFLIFFLKWRSARTHQFPFKPGLVHSGPAGWDDHEQTFPDKLCVSLFPCYVSAICPLFDMCVFRVLNMVLSSACRRCVCLHCFKCGSVFCMQ